MVKNCAGIRQHCRLSICENWLSWTNTVSVSEQKIPITILILKQGPCLGDQGDWGDQGDQGDQGDRGDQGGQGDQHMFAVSGTLSLSSSLSLSLYLCLLMIFELLSS